MIYTPEYGQSVLAKFFDDVEIRDYSKTKTCKDKYLSNGIMVLAYDTNRDIAASIRYIPVSEGEFKLNQVEFTIESHDRGVVSSCWKPNELDASTYEFFLDILMKIASNMDSLVENARSFNSKSWIKRHKKISQVV